MFGVILRSFWVANDHTWNKKFGCKCNEVVICCVCDHHVCGHFDYQTKRKIGRC